MKPAVPFLLRTATDVPRLCQSLGHFTAQPPQSAQALADAVDRFVDRAEALLAEDRRAQLGRDLAEVPIVMVGVRRHV